MLEGKLYVGVHAAHSDKSFLVRVRPPKEVDLPKDKIASS